MGRWAVCVDWIMVPLDRVTWIGRIDALMLWSVGLERLAK
jgi:hypothetical protein